MRTTKRELPVAGLYRLPTEDDRRTTTLDAGELILELDVPRPGRSAYLKAMERQRWSFPIVGVAVALTGDERRIVLAYTGAPRNSGTNNWEITKRHIDGDREIFDCFERIRDAAARMRDALGAGDWDEVGRQIVNEWTTRKRLAPGVTTPEIDGMLAAARNVGAIGGKVCGAGGGGCLFCLGAPEDVPAIRQALQDRGARLLDFTIEPDGLRVESRVAA